MITICGCCRQLGQVVLVLAIIDIGKGLTFKGVGVKFAVDDG